jgi:hypothetical protein
VILNRTALFAVARVSFDGSPQVTANAVIGGDCVSTKKYFDWWPRPFNFALAVPRSKDLLNFHVAEIAVEIMSRSGRFVRLLLVAVIAG